MSETFNPKVISIRDGLSSVAGTIKPSAVKGRLFTSNSASLNPIRRSPSANNKRPLKRNANLFAKE